MGSRSPTRSWAKGPQTLVYAPPVTNLYSLWELPRAASFLRRLSEEARVVVFNPRGTGLSDRPRNLTLESPADDLNAVLDAIEQERATIFGGDVSANVCALFAASFPERCDRLVLFVPHARALRSDSYEYGGTEEEAMEWIREWRTSWGDREQLESFARALFHPEITEEEGFLDWFVKERRLAASPAAAVEFARMATATDITAVLGSIRVSTWSCTGNRIVTRRVRRCSHPGRDIVELGGDGVWLYADDVAEAVLSFLRGEAVPSVPDSVLATVLLTDIVGSTQRAAELGDRGWRGVLERHHAQVRSELARYRGIEVDSAGDGFFCRFDGPARAIACALAVGGRRERARYRGARRDPHGRVRARRRKDRRYRGRDGSRLSSLGHQARYSSRAPSRTSLRVPDSRSSSGANTTSRVCRARGGSSRSPNAPSAGNGGWLTRTRIHF